MLRRLVLILMLALLPLQWTWAAAASVCQHEEIVATADGSLPSPHFGHHEHQHEHQQEDGHEPGQAGPDLDCPSCHVVTPALLLPRLDPQPPLLAARVATPYQRSITAGLPERLIRPPHSPRLARD